MRHYRELWLILAGGFALFFVLSVFDGIALTEDYELRSAGFAKAVFGGREAVAEVPEHVEEIAEEAKVKDVPTDTTSQTILFIGDSMLDGLSPRMADYCLQNGHKLVSYRWYSSSTSKWGAQGTEFLRGILAQYKPTYVFICLGANELFVSKPAEKCGPAVERILESLGRTPYVWIGPPNWKPDTGINDVIASKSAPGCFFLSNGMEFERKKDGAHPTAASAVEWLDSVMRWMPHNCAHPIRMEVPQKPLPAKAPGQIIIKLRNPNE
ncbi:MAG: hypothetical protein K2L96_00355 [Muribaculaceae bacterium]|nr:hypothetical protein [Muribaculaceae bacterium]